MLLQDYPRTPYTLFIHAGTRLGSRKKAKSLKKNKCILLKTQGNNWEDSMQIWYR